MRGKICLLQCILIIISCLQGCNNNEVVVFEDYQGPILPLSIVSDENGIVAERYITCDYSEYKCFDDYAGNDNRLAKITDKYILKNTNNEDVVLRLAYGFPATYATQTDMIPHIKINGEEVPSKLFVGKSAVRYELKQNSKSSYLYEREGFEKMLSDGIYLQDAFEETKEEPVFNERVTVYKFSDLVYRGDKEKVNMPKAEFVFEFDDEKTEIYTYGVNTFSRKGERNSLGFGVATPQDPRSGLSKEVYVIALGEKLNAKEVNCYRHQMASIPTDVFTVEYVEYEATFGEVLEEIVEKYKLYYHNTRSLYADLTKEQVLEVGKEFIADERKYGQLDEVVLALDDYLFGAYADWRVVYQSTEVTIPANESVEVVFDYNKNTGIKKFKDTPYDGIEIMTSLGSELSVESQMLQAVGMDGVNISERTTGEALEQGAKEVEMDKDFFEIYLEVPKQTYKPQGWWNRKP